MNNSLRKLIPFYFAAWSIVVINSFVIVFLLLVVFGVIPFYVVWGSKLQNKEEMYGFETASILINVLLVISVLLKRKHLEQPNGPAKCTKDGHAFFGKFTPEEWAVFQWKHLDHHLRQFGV